MQVSIS